MQPQVASDFAHDEAEEYLQIYSEAAMVFPVFIESMINMWKSIFLALSVSPYTSVDVVSSKCLWRVTKIKFCVIISSYLELF